MHYAAIVDGHERQVEITELAPGRYQLVVDGERREVDARMISDTTLSLITDHQAYNIEIEPRADGPSHLLVRGHVVGVEVLDLRRLRLRRAQETTTAPCGPVTIVSPMPGKVVAVLVLEGAEVEEGQAVVVVEAMKMENELRSPRAGTVRELNATVGSTVEAGAVLLRVE